MPGSYMHTPAPPALHAARPDNDRTQLCKSFDDVRSGGRPARSEEHTSDLQSLMRISYAVFCLKKKLIQLASISLRARSITTTTTTNYILKINKYSPKNY